MSTGGINPNNPFLSPLPSSSEPAPGPAGGGSSQGANQADTDRFNNLMGNPSSLPQDTGASSRQAVTRQNSDRGRDDESSHGNDSNSSRANDQNNAQKSGNDQSKDSAKGSDSQGKSSDADAVAAAMGASILHGMGMMSGPAGPASASASTPTTATQAISEVGGEVADKILVSDPELNANQQVTLVIKNDVLPETSVDIFKTPDGLLNVRFATESSDANGVLTQNQQGLAEMLRDKLKLDQVNVTVQYKANAPGQGDGGQNEGRSRQQRDLYDEMNQQ